AGRYFLAGACRRRNKMWSTYGARWRRWKLHCKRCLHSALWDYGHQVAYFGRLVEPGPYLSGSDDLRGLWMHLLQTYGLPTVSKNWFWLPRGCYHDLDVEEAELLLEAAASVDPVCALNSWRILLSGAS